jgi:hypothetical protein
MNLTTSLTDIDGNEFQDKSTVKTAILGSLMNPLPGDETMVADKKVALFKLALKVNDTAADCQLTAEEVAMIKERVGKGYPPLIVGRVFQLLDPASV